MKYIKKIIVFIATLLSAWFLSNDYTLLIHSISQRRAVLGKRRSHIHKNLSLAVQAAEDRAFLNHSGFHARGILRAVWMTLLHGRIQGASTIEQQLVRVIRNRYEFSVGRKLSEIIIAASLGKHLSKQEVMEFYLEIAYFGWKGNGVKEICRRLSFDEDELTIKQACQLASMLKLPMPRTPSTMYMKRLKERSEYIEKVLGKL